MATKEVGELIQKASALKVLQVRPDDTGGGFSSCEESIAPRTPNEIRDMAAIAQLNLFRLQAEVERRTGRVEFAGRTRIQSPTLPSRFGDCVVDPAGLREYSDVALCLRFHEVWGQFCTFLWYFHRTRPADAPDIGTLPSLPETRCGASRAAKHDEIHAVLWKLRFEQRQRADEQYRLSPEFRKDQFLASRIPVPLFERDMADCTDEELLIGACEYAGMLAAVRWLMDANRAWGEADIMAVSSGPFPPDTDENPPRDTSSSVA